MDDKSAYTECELRYIDQGYDLERAKEVCADEEGRSSDEESGGSSKDDYWGEV